MDYANAKSHIRRIHGAASASLARADAGEAAEDGDGVVFDGDAVNDLERLGEQVGKLESVLETLMVLGNVVKSEVQTADLVEDMHARARLVQEQVCCAERRCLLCPSCCGMTGMTH